MRSIKTLDSLYELLRINHHRSNFKETPNKILNLGSNQLLACGRIL